MMSKVYVVSFVDKSNDGDDSTVLKHGILRVYDGLAEWKPFEYVGALANCLPVVLKQNFKHGKLDVDNIGHTRTYTIEEHVLETE